MSYRSILVPVDGGRDNRVVLENALNVASRFGAHVDIMHVRPDPRDAVPMFGEGLSGDMVEDMIRAADLESAERAHNLKTLCETVCRDRGVPQVDGPGGGADAATVSWLEKTGREDEFVARRGRLADLVVSARVGEDGPPMRSLSLHAALFECGRPVLVFPPDPTVEDLGRVMAVAWSGTAQGARAVQAAMPMIVRASEVHVLTCESERTEMSAGDELAQYLGWWGVTPNVHTFPPGTDGVGQALLDKANGINADILVCGAYSHSRLMQTVIGGVTSVLMDKANLPVLFSH